MWNMRSAFMVRYSAGLACLVVATLPAQSAWVWQPPNQGVSPPYGATSAAFDARRGIGVVAGGMSLLPDQNVTLEWDGGTWARIPGSPSQVGNPVAVAYDGVAILAVCENRTWRWDGASWTDLQTSFSPPHFTQLAYDPLRDRVVAFGGGGAMVALDETWEWDGLSWTRITPAIRPPERIFHAIAFDHASGKVLLFGGQSSTYPGSSVLGDTWEWDGVDWTQRYPAHRPPARASHTLTSVESANAILLHGGRDPLSTSFSDLWSWDGRDWVQESPWGAARSRSRHAAFVFPRAWGPDVVFYEQFGAVQVLSDFGTMASYTTYRSSCASSAGVPYMTNLTVPRVGQRLDLQITGLGPSKVGYLLFGFSDQYWGVNPLPLDLTAFGAPGCFMHVDPLVAFIAPSDAAGVARVSWRVWTDPAYLGVEFFNQFVTLSDAPAGRPLAITTTNAGRGVVGL
jgi:hypothetical protein